MKNVFKSSKTYMVLGLLIIAVTASAWQFKSKQKPGDTAANNAAGADTTKHRHNDKDEAGVNENRDWDNDVNVDLHDLNINLRGLDTMISKTVHDALANIDWNDISRQTNEALNSVDWKQINVDVNRSVKEAMDQVKNIDMSEVHREIEKAQEEVKDQLGDGKLQKTIDDAMDQVREGLDNVRTEVNQYKSFTRELQDDGLIDKKKGYKIEWKDDGSLYINNKLQSKEVTDKYYKYYRKGGYTINNGANDDNDE